MDKIELATPLRTIIVKVLSHNPKMLTVFGRTKEKDLFFKDLLTIGCDFYELLIKAVISLFSASFSSSR